MSPITGTYQDGHVVLDTPVDWPEGAKVAVVPTQPERVEIGISEDEWRDDPESLTDWEAWIKTIEPLEITPEEEAAISRFQDEMRRYNVEAVRRQMEEGPAE